ncbi:MAG: hypothetical protein M1832_005258 [Thelocarpon impressellum]|nr:MAG: hypothetical protein M1832_005258 [Thelocarpon impressellum]
MELSRQEYPAMLVSLQPGQAVALLNERVKRVGKLNSEVADWLSERRKVEEAYVQGLRKLARRQPPDDASEMGIFTTPWQKLVSSVDALASSHHVLAQKIEVDVERPLRDFAARNREMQALSTIQGNLGAMAKEIETAQDKADKLKRRGAKAPAGKVAAATSEVDSATTAWDSQAPFVFESLQAADETRLNHLRDVLTQFQTHEVDQVERNRVTAEECLNALLVVETADEIRAFAARSTGGRPRLQPRPRRQSTNNAGTLSPSTAHGPDDTASQLSGNSAGTPVSGAIQEVKQHDRFGGLKRLGTVIGKRRQSIYGRAPSPGKRSTDLFGAFGRGSQDVPPLPSPGASVPNLTSSPSREPRAALSRIDSSPSAQRSRGRRSRDQTNGDTVEHLQSAAITNPQSPQELNGSGIGDVPPLQQDVAGTPFNVPGAARVDQQRDPEGFTIPPSASDAISQAEQEAATENAQPQFKLDIRSDPIHEEDGDAETALANVASTLRAQAAPTRKTGTIRGRRDVRNTIFIPSGQAATVLDQEQPAPHSPPKLGRAATLQSEDAVASDTQSIRSSRSLSSLVSNVVKHPDMHEPGLNSSIVETVSAWFENGRVNKAVVIGELALAYNATDGVPPPSGPHGIRLENFPVLEKVAPNPTFVTQIPDRSGEYHLNLAGISRTAVAFKYQLHLDETNLGAHAPLTMTPAWKVEASQTSVILSYSLNPAFAAGLKKAVTLHNLVVIIHLDAGRPTSCQSKPVGSFSKERSLIYWRLGDVTLAPDASPAKVLARFATETEGKPGAVEARWEISGEQGLGSGLELSQVDETRPAATDPFADESAASSPSAAWRAVPSQRRLGSGKYTAV